MWNWLNGKKTYISAAGAALTALGALLAGEITLLEFALAAFGAGGLAGLRSGVKKDAGK